MESYLFYIGKSALAAGAFYLVYLLLFQNQKQFVFNRIYLPVSLALSFFIPLITFTQIQFVEPITTSTFNNSTFLSYLPEATAETPFVFQWFHYLIGIYILGTTGFLFHLLLGHVKALGIIRYSRIKELFKTAVNVTPKDVHPFSFFNKIVLSENTLKNPSLEIIVSHEHIHVKEKHTFDILFAEILFLLQWFNPFAWLLKDAIKNNLEYKTDHQIAKTFNVQAYQLAMVGLADKQGIAPFLTALNGSQLKNRIIMMKKKTENKFVFLKQLVVLPLLAVLIMGLANREVKTEIVQHAEININELLEENNVQGKIVSRENEMPIEGVGIYNNIGNKLASSDIDGEFSFRSEEIKDNFILIKEGFQPKHFEIDLTDKKKANVDFQLNIQLDVQNQQEVVERIVLGYKNSNNNIGRVYYNVEEMPEFPGGESAMKKFLMDKIVYPEDALENGIWGDAYVSFIIDKEGKIIDSQISRGIHPSLDEEALRVVNSLPEWEPGKVEGENVNVRHTVPVNFRITKKRVDSKSKAWFDKKGNKKYIITGKVTDQNNDPISRATIIVKGKTTGTITDQNGNYELQLNNENETLVFVVQGATKYEVKVKVKGKTEINVKTDYVRAKDVLYGDPTLAKHKEKKFEISGKVTNEKGEPVKGTAVLIKDKPIGTITNRQGYYLIGDDMEIETLVCSNVGYKTQEVKVSGSKKINVKLKADKNTKTGDVKVISYGTQIRPTVVESHINAANTVFLASKTGKDEPLYIVDGIEIDNLDDVPVNNVESMTVLKDKSATSLYGKKAKNGVVLITTKAAAAKIKFDEGKSTSYDSQIKPAFPEILANNNSDEFNFGNFEKVSLDGPKLIIVDGIEVENAEDIDPKDIESISVLKDKSATAIYGEKGKNGVVLITTKTAAAVKAIGKAQLFVDGKEFKGEINDIPVSDISSVEVRKNQADNNIYDGIDPEKDKIIIQTRTKYNSEELNPKVLIKDTETGSITNELDPNSIESVSVKNGTLNFHMKENEAIKGITTPLQLRKFIADKIKYPKEAQDANLQSTTSFFFRVDKNGNIFDIRKPGTADINLDEIVVIGYKSKIPERDIREADRRILANEMVRVLKLAPPVQIPEFMEKTIKITVKFQLQ